MKNIPVIVALIIVVALAVAGCVNPTANTTISPSPSVRPDAQLAEYINVYRQLITEQHPKNLTAFNVTWKNNTTVYIQMAYTTTPHGNITYHLFRENSTLIRFSYAYSEIPPYVYRNIANTSFMQTVPLNDSSYTQHYDAFKRMEGHSPFIYIMWGGPTYISNHTAVAENVDRYSTRGQTAEQIHDYLWIEEYSDEILETTIH